jgi:hypothetical protein
MRIPFRLILLGAILAIRLAEQADRKECPRPPPPERMTEPPIVVPARRASIAPPELTVMPARILKGQFEVRELRGYDG